MNVRLDKWYRPKIDKEILKELNYHLEISLPDQQGS